MLKQVIAHFWFHYQHYRKQLLLIVIFDKLLNISFVECFLVLVLIYFLCLYTPVLIKCGSFCMLYLFAVFYMVHCDAIYLMLSQTVTVCQILFV